MVGSTGYCVVMLYVFVVVALSVVVIVGAYDALLLLRLLLLLVILVIDVLFLMVMLLFRRIFYCYPHYVMVDGYRSLLLYVSDRLCFVMLLQMRFF